MNTGTVIATIGLFFTIIGLLYKFYKDDIGKMKEDIATIKTKVEPIWKYVELQIIQILHHPITPEIDKYLDKMKNGLLLNDDAITLYELIKKEIPNTNDNLNEFRLILLDMLKTKYVIK